MQLAETAEMTSACFVEFPAQLSFILSTLKLVLNPPRDGPGQHFNAAFRLLLLWTW